MCKHLLVFVFASRPLTLESESTLASVFFWICGEEQSWVKKVSPCLGFVTPGELLLGAARRRNDLL